MIDWTKFPKRFTLEAIDRFVFVPESATHASEEQVRALLEDAQSYIGKSGQHDRTPGLGISARAVVRVCRQALDTSALPVDGVIPVEPGYDIGTGHAPIPKRKRPAWVLPICAATQELP
jgi:hypothetical protein